MEKNPAENRWILLRFLLTTTTLLLLGSMFWYNSGNRLPDLSWQEYLCPPVSGLGFDLNSKEKAVDV